MQTVEVQLRATVASWLRAVAAGSSARAHTSTRVPLWLTLRLKPPDLLLQLSDPFLRLQPPGLLVLTGWLSYVSAGMHLCSARRLLLHPDGGGRCSGWDLGPSSLLQRRRPPWRPQSGHFLLCVRLRPACLICCCPREPCHYLGWFPARRHPSNDRGLRGTHKNSITELVEIQQAVSVYVELPQWAQSARRAVTTHL